MGKLSLSQGSTLTGDFGGLGRDEAGLACRPPFLVCPASWHQGDCLPLSLPAGIVRQGRAGVVTLRWADGSPTVLFGSLP
jgi:hypothetical protein